MLCEKGIVRQQQRNVLQWKQEGMLGAERNWKPGTVGKQGVAS